MTRERERTTNSNNAWVILVEPWRLVLSPMIREIWLMFENTLGRELISCIFRRNVPLSTSSCSLSWYSAGPGSFLEDNTYSSG
jgi:hypothetical protein